MQKISDSTNTADLAGEFTEGNPAAGVPATLLKASWLNTVQRELEALVLAAGIKLNASDDQQVLKAIKALAGVAADFNKLLNKPYTISGYGITDAYTKQEMNNAIGGLVARDSISHAGLDGGDITKPYMPRASDGAIVPLASIAGLNSKADKATTLSGYGITDAYTKAQADQQTNFRALRNNITVVGLSNNDLGAPYMTRESDGAIAWLQPRLGYTPIQQGGGIGQLPYPLKIGWSPAGLKLTVDSVDLGEFLLTSDCDLVGSIMYFAMSTPPTGFLKANGAAVSRVSYPRLFNKIGTYYGPGDGSTTFNLPDLRGEVIRGHDDGRGVDLGRVLGSVQLDAFQGHSRAFYYNAQVFVGNGGGNAYAMLTAGGGNNVNGLQDAVRGAISDGVNGPPRVATETRARNIAFLACIKY